MVKLGYRFNNVELLKTAVTHRSAGAANNERMEFLGDALLGVVISAELFRRFTTASEGQLSRLRASLVKGETLAELANNFQLGEALILGSGELKSGGFRRESILADAFEAIIGAVYLDSEMDTVSHYILNCFEEKLAQSDADTLSKDPKTRLQEHLQGRGESLPQYTVLNISGKEHNQVFEVECKIAGLSQQFVAQGSSRRKAEQAVAQSILETLGL